MSAHHPHLGAELAEAPRRGASELFQRVRWPVTKGRYQYNGRTKPSDTGPGSYERELSRTPGQFCDLALEKT